MFAVLRSGGKQYTVRQGDVLSLERLEGDEGCSIVLQDILAMGSEGKITLGEPTVADAGVQVKILETKKDKKVLVFKKKRRQGYKRLKGHRQWISVVRVESLLEKGAEKAAKIAAEAPAKKIAASKKTADPGKKPTEKKAPATKKSVASTPEKAPAKKAAAPKKAENKAEK